MSLARRALAEMVGTWWLVLGGCGAAVLAGTFIGFNGISLAFGLTVVTMAYAIGAVSGCHLNPAVSIGLAVAKRMPARDLPAYLIVLLIAKGAPLGYDPAVSGLAANGYGEHSPAKFSLVACLVTEVVMTAFFLFVIIGATSPRAPLGFAGLPVGLCLTLIHLVSIPITNTSVNPARSTGPALFVGGWALEQLWLFWVAPIGGAVIAAVVWRALDPVPPTGVVPPTPSPARD
jgi:aquaporin Z